jgi:hypothetical protein
MKKKNSLEAMERKKARLLEEAAAIDRDMADIARLTAKYNLIVSEPDTKPAREKPTAAKAKSQQNERRAVNGSVARLVRRYRDDEHSPYQKVHFRSRAHYASLLRRIDLDLGSKKICEIKSRDLLAAHQLWTARGVAMAHALAGMLRMLCNYGATVLGDGECERLSVLLHNMRFPKAKSSNGKRLTADHVEVIIRKAHEMGLHSIALAQAFQSDCMLHQRDVIGEWVPNSEPGVSDVTHRKEKWLRGIRWSGIDENLILRHTTSKGRKGLKDIEINLQNAPRVMAEFNLIGTLPQGGPMVISEASGVPYKAHDFRAVWRKVARAAGIPDEIKNMDSRAGDTSRSGEDRISPGALAP